jgi:hypothetical protein
MNTHEYDSVKVRRGGTERQKLERGSLESGVQLRGGS